MGIISAETEITMPTKRGVITVHSDCTGSASTVEAAKKAAISSAIVEQMGLGRKAVFIGFAPRDITRHKSFWTGKETYTVTGVSYFHLDTFQQ